MTTMSPLMVPSSDRIGDAAIRRSTVLPRRFSADRLMVDVLFSPVPISTPRSQGAISTVGSPMSSTRMSRDSASSGRSPHRSSAPGLHTRTRRSSVSTITALPRLRRTVPRKLLVWSSSSVRPCSSSLMTWSSSFVDWSSSFIVSSSSLVNWR